MTSNGEKQSSAVNQQIVLALREARTRLEAAERAKTEPIAVIGIGCRFPGGADNPDLFWHLLQNGKDAATEIPRDRWNVDDYYDANPDLPGKMYIRSGGFLQHPIDRFDPQFFGISHREAASMDPQQRLLLEVSWEALENAGQAVENLRHSRTGVFMGMCWDDYAEWTRNPETSDMYGRLGTIRSVAAGRISYVLGLQGPSILLDTACSSSLVAVHLACQSLRANECDMALAGGVNLIISPLTTLERCRAKVLSPDGRCKTFDASADGYGQGEGCGAIVLKRLSDALADKDPILALVRGSAINHDGPSSGLTVPNEQAQEDLIWQALKNARVKPEQIDYVEAHGTGTSLGDPIEVGALAAVFAANHSRDRPLLIGSVKTNIGHLEGAAGIACFIKLVLALRHEEIPPHLHFQHPNPHIDWECLPIKVVSQRTPWIRGRQPRLAGVSSFGISGTNAHIVLEEAPVPPVATGLSERPRHLIALSAKSKTALEQLASSYKEHLLNYKDTDLANFCFTANSGRSHFRYRVGIATASTAELSETLEAISSGTRDIEAIAASVAGMQPKIVFLFTGQGSQHTGMGWQLYQTQPTFKKALDRCAEILHPHLERSLLEVLYPQQTEDSRLDQTTYTQPALFALEYALYQLWTSWGIQPQAVMGHSVGEYVAACVAGVFTLEEGLKLIAARGRLMGQLPAGGEMVSVMAGVERVKAAIPKDGSAVIAAINGPESTAISGRAAAVREAIARLEVEGIKSKPLKVSHGFHSPLMEPMLAEFEQVARQINYSPPQREMISNVTGKVATAEVATPEYWCRQILSPVNFAAGMKALHQRGYEIFLECGAKPILLGMGRQCLSEEEGVWLPSLRPGRSDWQQMLESLGELYVRGVKVDWQGFDRDYPQRRKVSLPTYPFQRQRYWVDVDNSRNEPQIPPLASSEVLSSIARGEVDRLVQMLQKTTAFSPEQVRLLPTVLGALVEEHRKRSAAGSISDWLYQLEWRAKGRLGKLPPPDFLLSPTQIEGQLQSMLPELSDRERLAASDRLSAHLEELSLALILQAFAELGWQLSAGERLATESIAKQLGAIPQHRRLLHRMLQILAEAGFIERLGEEWQILRIPDIETARENVRALSNTAIDAPELRLLKHCGSRLSEVLRGAVDGLHLVFPNGDDTLVEQIYQDSPSSKITNVLAQKALSLGLKDLPRDRGIRILEVGAGTGGTTGYLLPHLNPNRTEYTFTDVGTTFLNNARSKFQDYPFVRYRLLNIEEDPIAQGFDRQQYDVIVAANVLHATASIRQTLQHLRQLLAPGGLLILIEATQRPRWLDLTFGLLDGWWRFKDVELRPDHALLSVSQWRQVMLNSGFSQIGTQVSDNDRAAIVIGQVREDSPALNDPAVEGNWLILADRQGATRQLASKLAGNCIIVRCDSKFQQLSSREFTLDPQDPGQFKQLIDRVKSSTPGLRGVIHCWSLDGEIDPAANLVEALQQVWVSTPGLIEALAIAQWDPPPKIWLVTQGARPVLKDGIDLCGAIQSTVWGLANSLSLAHPEFRIGCLDLDPTASASERARALWQEIAAEDSEDRIALRQGDRYVARLVRSRIEPPSRPAILSEDRTYLLVAGGTLDYPIVRWLVNRGAKSVAIVEASSSDDSRWDRLSELEQRGARIKSLRADLSDLQSCRQTISTIEQALSPLAGIICVPRFRDLTIPSQLNWRDQMAEIVLPELQGIWNLHSATQYEPLDFFILFSSTSSLLGALGENNRAAAGAFLDGLIDYRQARGLSGLNIHWSNIVLENTIDAESGVRAIRIREMLEVLERLLGSAATSVGVSPARGSELLVGREEWSLLSEWRELTSIESVTVPQISFRQRLRAEIPDRQRELLLEHVKQQVAIVLGFKPSQTINIEQGLIEMGMDSLTAVELRNRLQRSLECAIQATVLFEFPTIEKMANHLADRLLHLDSGGVSNRSPDEAIASQTSDPESRLMADASEPGDREILDGDLAAKLAKLKTYLED